MKLSNAELKAMNGSIRQFLHRRVEFPLLVRMGLHESAGRDVVELGCGNGLGAELIAGLGPRSYVGIDVMPEQIALAQERNLSVARFLVGDASAVELPDSCADVVVILGILHHVERWREAIAECRRLLRPGGALVVEEPDAALLRGWNRVLHWNHPQAGFSLAGVERELQEGGMRLERRWKLPGVFGAYRARMASAAVKQTAPSCQAQDAVR
jgi:ubiquinone/menaquinone biosynthesis C-methylase UbiE